MTTFVRISSDRTYTVKPCEKAHASEAEFLGLDALQESKRGAKIKNLHILIYK
jgi:hypothetical protein